MTNLLAGYLHAKSRIIEAGFVGDIDWADQLEFVKPDAHYVLRETSWVILNSGFKYSVAKKLWPNLSNAFFQWDPALVTNFPNAVISSALGVFGHEKKIAAMMAVAKEVASNGHESIVTDAREPQKLMRLPFIGKITCYHLAKVLGADVIKPDVHLGRAGLAAGYALPQLLCERLKELTGDRLTVIDSVLWRYGEQQKTRGWPVWAELWAMKE